MSFIFPLFINLYVCIICLLLWQHCDMLHSHANKANLNLIELRAREREDSESDRESERERRERARERETRARERQREGYMYTKLWPYCIIYSHANKAILN